MLDTIRASMFIAGPAIIGPGADTAIVLPVWIGMMIKLASQAGSSIDNQLAKRLSIDTLAATATSIGAAKLSLTTAAWLFTMSTGGLSIATTTAHSAVIARLTDAFGRAAARYLLQTSKIEDVDEAAKILIGLVEAELGIPTSSNYIVE